MQAAAPLLISAAGRPLWVLPRQGRLHRPARDRGPGVMGSVLSGRPRRTKSNLLQLPGENLLRSLPPHSVPCASIFPSEEVPHRLSQVIKERQQMREEDITQRSKQQTWQLQLQNWKLPSFTKRRRERVLNQRLIRGRQKAPPLTPAAAGRNHPPHRTTSRLFPNILLRAKYTWTLMSTCAADPEQLRLRKVLQTHRRRQRLQDSLSSLTLQDSLPRKAALLAPTRLPYLCRGSHHFHLFPKCKLKKERERDNKTNKPRPRKVISYL